ncbi:MAG: hypothetical protein IK010_01095 [Bacteroidales bacterium]|nr:hypothetical protein [Bacteroidales bacterium]
MKKVFQFAAIAVVALALTVACKSKTEAVPEDTTPMEVVEDTMDTIEEVAEEMIVEEPVKTTAKQDEGIKKATADQAAKRTRNTELKETKEKVEIKADETASSTKKVADAQKRTESNRKGL